MIAPLASMLFALASASACHPVEQSSKQLRAAADQSQASFDRVLSALRGELGHPLLREGEGTSDEDRVELATRRLQEVCDLRRRLISYPASDRERLKRILDRAEFAGARVRSHDWLTRAVEWLKEWLDSFFQSSGVLGFAQGTRAAVLAMAIALALAGLMRVLRVRRPSRAIAAIPTGEAPLRLEAPAVHLATAQAALASDPREAIRQGLLCLLSWLERRRLARPDRAKTNRELAEELPARGASSDLSSAVRGLMRWYDAAFYSLSPVQRGEAHDFLERIAHLQSSHAGVPD